MIAHVAEASEHSGRVVLWLDPEAWCASALLDAPVRLAAAYGAEVETIIVLQGSDNDMEDVPVRRVARAFQDTPKSGFAPSEQRFGLLAQRCRRSVETAGKRHQVKVRHALAYGDAIDRISEMCVARGPWNIVALPRLPALGGPSVISTLLANVSGATGFFLSGESPKAVRSRIVVVAEDVDRLPSMLRAADRISGDGAAVRIIIGADTKSQHDELEAQVRLLTADAKNVVFESIGPTLGVPGALTELMARLKPSIVIARFGGSAFADGRELARASAVIRAPILIVR